MNITLNISKYKKTRLKKAIKFVIIHYTGMQSKIDSIKRLKNSKTKVVVITLLIEKEKSFKWLR